MTIWSHSSCQSRIFLPFPPLLLLENVGNLLKHCPIGPSNSSIPSLEVDLVKMPWNFRHWSVSDIDHRQTGVCFACSRCGTFLFALLLVVVLWPQISGKDSPTHAWVGKVMRWSWVNFQCRGILLIWVIVGQGPIALAVGAGGGCLDVFFISSIISLLSPSLWETV